MATKAARVVEGLRIAWAIAAKDIVDAVKNKTTLSTILSVLFLILFYRWLPNLQVGETLPKLALYDAGGSQLTAALRESTDLDLVELPSLEQMQSYVADRDEVVLGLALPVGLDQGMASGGALELDGYAVHWAGASAVEAGRALFERQLSALVGRPVRIRTAGHTIYPNPDSRGMSFLASVTVVIVVLACGILLVPSLMLEEKQTRTIEALLASPAGSGHLVAGKALAGVFYCLAGAAVVLALNAAVITHWGLAALATLCGSLLAVAAGLLLGSLLEVRQQLALWNFVLFIPLLIPIFLSVEPQLVPVALQRILPFVPTVAFARALRVSFSELASPGLWGPPLAVVLGWAALLLASVAWVVRRADRP